MTQIEANPYVGPRPFERNKDDALRFFGRAKETEEIVSLIFGHPLLLVYAQSGAGKTSLFNASISLKLEENGFDVLPLARVMGVVPQEVDLHEINNLYILNALLKMDPETDPRTLLSESFSTFLETRTQSTDENGQLRPRVIIFDQFEELFTFTPERWREQRNGFFLQVADALNTDPLLRVVFVIREDFLAELDPYAHDLPERLRTRYRLELLGEEAALRAVTDPLANTSRKFVSGVAEYLVNELLVMRTVDATGKMIEVEGHYVEPVQLQVVCVTLWSALEPDVTEIQQSHLKDFNVSDALSNFYETTIEFAVEELSVQEANLRNWFGKTLITPMGTRNTVFRGEDSTGSIENRVVDFLESRHIIRAEFRAGVRWYELTHDRLVEPILASNRKWSENLSPLQLQATWWNDQRRNETLLFSDQALAQAETWAKEHHDELTQIEREFLKECQRKQKEKEQRQQARQRRIIANISIVAAIVTLALAVFGFVQAGLATANANEALNQAATAEANQVEAQKQEKIVRASLLAAQSQQLITEDFQTSLLLGIESFRQFDTSQSRNTLMGATSANPNLIQYLPGDTGAVYSVAFSPDGETLVSGSFDNTIILWDVETRQLMGQPLNGHTGAVYSVAFSPDGMTLASGSFDNTIILWDVRDLLNPSQLVTLAGDTGIVYSVVFSPDGMTLASGGADNTIILWDVTTGQPIEQPLKEHKDIVYSVAFSPDGMTLASGSADNTIILWNVATGQLIWQSTGHTEAIKTLIFSPDGETLASGGADNTIILWDITTGKPIWQTLTGYKDVVNSLTFSPDGKTLASGGADNTIILWDVTTGQPIEQPLNGHADVVNSLSFSPDGKTLASGSADNTIILWDLSDPSAPSQLGQLAALAGHAGAVYSVAFNPDPDGMTLASSSNDNTIRLWDASSGQQIGEPLIGHTDAVYSVAFSRDGETLASGGADNTIILWDASSGQQIGEPLIGHTDTVYSVAFSPDGETLVSGSFDNTIILWDVATGKPTGQPLNGHTGAVYSVAFSPDGMTLASGSWDNTIILWNVSDPSVPSQLATLAGHTDYVYSVSFSPDGMTLASGSADNTIILWDVETRQLMGQPLNGHPHAVYSVAFSPDDMTLASGSFDNAIILWDVRDLLDPSQLVTLAGHTGYVRSAVFSPDGMTFASGSDDNTIILWNVDPESWIELACQRAGRNFTQSEWNQYFPDQEYQITCDQWQSLEIDSTATETPTETQISTATVIPTITPLAAPATATMTPSTIIATPTPVLYRVINVTDPDRLNIRFGPGMKYVVIGKIPMDGRGIQVIGGEVQADNATWVPIIYNDITGWVNSYYIEPE